MEIFKHRPAIFNSPSTGLAEIYLGDMLKDDKMIVNNHVAEWLQYHSSSRCGKYAKTSIQGKIHLTHRLILQHYNLLPEDKEVDHINLNPLDNRLENLRPCTRSENNCNMSKRIGSVSKYFGVARAVNKLRWAASIACPEFYLNGSKRTIYLGAYDTEPEAAWAYRIAAQKRIGGIISPHAISEEEARQCLSSSLLEEIEIDVQRRFEHRQMASAALNEPRSIRIDSIHGIPGISTTKSGSFPVYAGVAKKRIHFGSQPTLSAAKYARQLGGFLIGEKDKTMPDSGDLSLEQVSAIEKRVRQAVEKARTQGKIS